MIISINKVKPDMVLAMPIYNTNGIVILNSGKVLDETTINALKRHGIESVEVQLTKEQEQLLQVDKDIYTTINERLRKESIKALKELDIDQILDSSRKIVDTISKSKEFSYSLLEYKEESDIYDHSVRVAAFASVLAKYYNKKLCNDCNDFTTLKDLRINIEHLTTAALTHDLGKTFKDKEFEIKVNSIPDGIKKIIPGIDNMPTNSFDENYSSFYTFCLLSQFPSIKTEIKLMTLFINEDQKGNSQLQTDKDLLNSKKNYIVASKIIRLCNKYDELLKKAIENNQTLENVSAELEFDSVNGILDKELTDLFLNHVPLYSVGVKVKLSDGKYAQVVKTFTKTVDNCKPIVKVVPTGEIIDLRSKTNLTISEICGNEVSFAELVARQIIDMNNEITDLDKPRIAR